MSRNRLSRLVLLLALVGASTPAFAAPGQTPPTAPGSGRAGPGGPGGPAAGGMSDADKAKRRARIKQRIRAVRSFELSDALDLDQATTTRMQTVLDKYDADLERLMTERMELRRKLDETAEASLDPVIDGMLANQRALAALDEKRFAELRRVLTKKQAAEAIVRLPEIERRVLRQLRAAVRDRRGGGDEGGDGPGRHGDGPRGGKAGPRGGNGGGGGGGPRGGHGFPGEGNPF